MLQFIFKLLILVLNISIGLMKFFSATLVLLLLHFSLQAQDTMVVNFKDKNAPAITDVRGKKINDPDCVNCLLKVIRDHSMSYRVMDDTLEYIMDQDADFGSAPTFIENTDFSNFRFNSGLLFDSSVFRGSVSFRRTEFYGDNRFFNANFREEADFSNAHFIRASNAIFENAHFQQPIYFNEAVFEGNTKYLKAHFLAEANFRGATFRPGSNVLFGNASLNKVDFSSSHVQPEAVINFSHAEFNDDAIFRSILIAGSCYFNSTVFHNSADFSDAKLEGELVFDSAVFEGDFH